MTEGHTVDTLSELFEAKIDAINGVLDERAKAITVAFANFEKRMDSTNEWRAALDDQTKTMASQQQLEALKDRIDKMEAAMLTSGGKTAGYGQLAAIIIGTLGAASILFTIMNALGK